MRLLLKLVQVHCLTIKALDVCRKIAGEFLHYVHAINAIKLADSDILAGLRYHAANSKPYFYDASYNHTRQLGTIPVLVDLNGRCVVAGNRHCCSMRPLKWKCKKDCQPLDS